MTGGSAQAAQTPSATSTLDSSGNASFAGNVTAANGFIGGASFSAAGAEIAAPVVTTPTLYFDSTLHLPQYKNAASVVVGTAIAPAASRTANQFVTHIPSTGTPATAAIADADVPATLTGKTVDGVTPTVFGYLDATSSVQTQLNAKSPKLTLPYGCAVGDPAGAALATGVLCYIVVPAAGTITGWDVVADAGTATVDVWKIAAGTAKPTVTNTITASAKPALASGTAIHSTTLTGWTTAVAANDIIGFNLDAVGAAKYITVNVQIAH
jgi:hypothetical protein